MKNDTQDWTLIEVLGYDLSNNEIIAKRLNSHETIRVGMKNDQNRNWIGWLSNPARPESAPKGSILALYNVESVPERPSTIIAGWGTTITKDITSENVLIAPFTISHKIKHFPDSGEAYLDGIALDNQFIAIDRSSDIKEAAISAIRNDNSPLQGQRGFMVRAINLDDPTVGHIEAFFGKRNSSPEELFEFHWNRAPNPGYAKNRLQSNAGSIQFNDFNKSNLVYEIVGFSRAIINTYGSLKQVDALSQLKNYRIPSVGDNPPRQAFSYAALVIDPSRPNQVRHHLPLPRAKINNSLFGNINISSEQKGYVGVLNAGGIKNLFRIRSFPKNHATKPPLQVADFVNKSGKVQSFRIFCEGEKLDRYAARIEKAIPGVKPFRVENGNAYSFPIEFKDELKAQLSDLLGTCPLYVRQGTINGGERLFLSGRVNELQVKQYIERLYATVPSRMDESGRRSFDLASYSQLASAIDNIPAATKPPQSFSFDPSIPKEEKQKQNVRAKMSFADWLEAKFMGRYDAMISFLYSEIESFAADEASIDWQHASSSFSVGNGTSQGDIVRGSKFVQPTKGNDTHSGSVAYAINTFEKSDPKFVNPLRWFNINFINKKLKRQGAFVFNGYDYLHEAYERDNGLEVGTNTQEHLKQMEEDRSRRQLEADRKWKAQLQEKSDARKAWMKNYLGLADEDGTSTIFDKKMIGASIGNIIMKKGVDAKLGRFTALRLHDLDNNFRGVQQLFEKPWADDKGNLENKLFVFGTQFKDDETENTFATHCVLGELQQGKPIYFVEGFSTGVSVFEATGIATVVALNAGNLPNVVAGYRARYPEATLIIVADNDQWKPLKGNPGVLAAVKSSFESDAHFVIPEFSKAGSSGAPTDANDLRVLHGVDALSSQLIEVNAPIKDKATLNRHIVERCGLEALSKEIDAIIEVEDEITRPAVLRSMLHAAVHAYGREKVLEYLAPDYREFVAFQNAKQPTQQPNQKASHLNGPKVEVFEAVSPSRKKYCLIRDNSRGESAPEIERALERIVGKSALSFNERLGGWVAPYPTINILKTYLYEQTGAPRMYVGHGRQTSSGQRFVIRGDFEDEGFKAEIIKKIDFADPRYLKSEFGLVIEDMALLDKVKHSLQEYLTNSPVGVNEFAKSNDPAEALISEALAKAKALSGEPVSAIVQATHRLNSGVTPSIFRDDDYVFAGLYQRSSNSLSDKADDQRHSRALSEAANMYISLDRQGLIDSHLSSGEKRRCRLLAIQVKAINDGKQLLAPEELDRIARKHDISQTEIINAAAGVNILPSENKFTYWNIQTDIQEIYSKLTYGALSKAPQTTKHKATELAQSDRIAELLELAGLAASDGYSLEEFQSNFLRSTGGPYNKDGSGFSHTTLQSDIVYIDANNILGKELPKLLTDVGLYDFYVEKASSERLDNYTKYINEMVKERGHLTYESFSAYLKGKRQPVVNTANPYLQEGEFNEELLEHDVARITFYKNHQAMYQDIGQQAANVGHDLFEGASEHEDQEPTAHVEVNQLSDESETGYTIISAKLNGEYKYRLRGSLQDHEGDSIAVDAWFSSEPSLRQYLGDITSHEHTDVEEIETDVIQHVSSKGATFSLCKTIGGQEVYYFSGGNKLADSTIQKVFSNKIEAQREYAQYKREMDQSNKQSLLNNSPQLSLPEFINSAVNLSMSPSEFLEKLSRDFKIDPRDRLIDSIKTQYDILLDRRKQEVPQAESKYDILQNVVTDKIRCGLDYDDIYEELINTEGTLVNENPYWNGSAVDKASLASDIKESGHQSLKSLYESRYHLIHGHPFTTDEVPIGSPYIPSVVNTNAPLDSQFNLLVETVKGFQMDHLSFDKHAFPTLAEWRFRESASLPIHPVLAVDLDRDDAATELNKFDKSSLILLSDIHGCAPAEEKSKEKLIDGIINSWAQRTLAASMTLDELKDLSSEDRQEIGGALGMSTEKRLSATMIKTHLNILETQSSGKLQDYSYIVAAIGYENRYGKLPAYAARDIQGAILNSDEYVQKEHTRGLLHKDRYEAGISLKVLVSLPTHVKASFNPDNIKQLEVVSSSGKDYIGKYKHFYHIKNDTAVLPRQVSHYGVYENSIIGLPYALSAEECHKHNISPISDKATLRVAEALDGWMVRHGAIGIQSPTNDSIYVLSKISDQYVLSFHDDKGLKNIESGTLSELLGKVPLELVDFADRNTLVEEIGSRLSIGWDISYANIMSRLGDGVSAETRAYENILSVRKFKDWLDEVKITDSVDAIHFVARKVIRDAAKMCIEGQDIEDIRSYIDAFGHCLPPATGVALSEVNDFTKESKEEILKKGISFYGVEIGNREDTELRKNLRESISHEFSVNSVFSEKTFDINLTSSPKFAEEVTSSEEVFFRLKTGHSMFGTMATVDEKYIALQSSETSKLLMDIEQLSPALKQVVIGEDGYLRQNIPNHIKTMSSLEFDQVISDLSVFDLKNICKAAGDNCSRSKSEYKSILTNRFSTDLDVLAKEVAGSIEKKVASKSLLMGEDCAPACVSYDGLGIQIPRDEIQWSRVNDVNSYTLEYSSIRELADKANSIDFRQCMLAHLYLRQEKISYTQLSKACNELPTGYNIVHNVSTKHSGWTFDGPEGKETEAFSSLRQAIDHSHVATAGLTDTLIKVDDAVKTFFKNGRIFEGHLEETITPSETKSVCMKIVGSEKIVSVDRNSVLPFTKDQLEDRYRQVAEGYRGSMRGFVEFLESEALSHADQPHSSEHNIYSYYVYRARSEAEKAEALIGMASHELSVSRLGRELVLDEHMNAPDGTEHISTHFSNLNRIESHLLESKKKTVRHDFEDEIRKSVPTAGIGQQRQTSTLGPNNR